MEVSLSSAIASRLEAGDVQTVSFGKRNLGNIEAGELWFSRGRGQIARFLAGAEPALLILKVARPRCCSPALDSR